VAALSPLPTPQQDGSGSTIAETIRASAPASGSPNSVACVETLVLSPPSVEVPTEVPPVKVTVTREGDSFSYISTVGEIEMGELVVKLTTDCDVTVSALKKTLALETSGGLSISQNFLGHRNGLSQSSVRSSSFDAFLSAVTTVILLPPTDLGAVTEPVAACKEECWRKGRTIFYCCSILQWKVSRGDHWRYRERQAARP
jgi:hypothetical protein